jgi:AcrR family transcriptional regulator
MPMTTKTARPKPKAPRSATPKKSAGKVVVSNTLDPVIRGTPLTTLVSPDSGVVGTRSKRSTIIDEAVRRFGQTGYEHTKWASIANEVGIGQTALYHYFESKAHCLLSIMRLELARSLQRFLLAVSAEGADPEELLRLALVTSFDVSDPEILQLRIVLANTDVLANPRATEREEDERQYCLVLTKAIENGWTKLVGEVLEQNKRTDQDPEMLSRAVLGLITSAWRWYRPKGRLSVEQLSEFYVVAAMRVVV